MIRFAFFGTSQYSVITLDVLKHAGLLPALIVTTPDKPRGRGLIMSPSSVKAWAAQETIPCLEPDNLADKDFIATLRNEKCHVFIVISYGKIIPKSVIDIPPHGALNIHPSLLPALRGSSPIENAILEDRRETGVSIISIDEKMDHGPIIAEEKVTIEPWPPRADQLGERLVTIGSQLLVKVLPTWVAGEITPRPQDDSKATYTKKIEKADGLIELSDNSSPGGDNAAYKNFLKIQAYAVWPRAYFFHIRKTGQKIRVTITSAEYKHGRLNLLKVIPDGKKEMAYADFIRNY